MARVYMALEPPLLAALQSGLAGYPGLGPEVRPKLPALLADLADLGCPGPRAPPARPVPVPPDLGAAAGGAYVLEGATLGGRVIARHLRRRLGGGPQDPLARAGFLDFHGDPAAAWMGFAADLDRLVELGAIDPESAIAGARAAFGLALGLLAEP
jgi:heme oxygenase